MGLNTSKPKIWPRNVHFTCKASSLVHMHGIFGSKIHKRWSTRCMGWLWPQSGHIYAVKTPNIPKSKAQTHFLYSISNTSSLGLKKMKKKVENQDLDSEWTRFQLCTSIKLEIWLKLRIFLFPLDLTSLLLFFKLQSHKVTPQDLGTH